MLRLWAKANHKITDTRIQISKQCRIKNLLKKTLLGLKICLGKSKGLESSLRVVEKNNDFKTKSRFFRAFRMACTKKKYISRFIIKRFRKFMSKLINKWFDLRQRHSRKKYLTFKAEEFHLYHTMQKRFKIWEMFQLREMKFRKLKIFLKYWKIVYLREKQDFENYTIGCRNRHLKSYYFKHFKIAFRISKSEKKADLMNLQRIFNSFRKRIIISYKTRAWLTKALQYCDSSFYLKIVNYS